MEIAIVDGLNSHMNSRGLSALYTIQQVMHIYATTGSDRKCDEGKA
jgi:hypothetical protein